MLVDAPKEARRDLELDCREFLRRYSAPSSDPGFALAAWRDVSPEVVTWGRQAKHTRHFRSEAIELAKCMAQTALPGLSMACLVHLLQKNIKSSSH